MIFRFTLSHNGNSQVISEPDGWQDAVLKLERDEEFHSLIEHFEGSFIFYGSNDTEDGGIDFIRQVEATGGPDAAIGILIEISLDGIVYETVFTGELNLATKQENDDNTAEIEIVPADFWTKFIKRQETPVNLQSPTDVDGNAVEVKEAVSLNLIPQPVPAEYFAIEDYGVLITMDQEFLQYQPNKIELSELKQTFILARATNSEKPVWIFEPEFDGETVFDFRIEYSKTTLLDGTGHTGARTVYDIFFQLNDETPIEFTYTAGAYVDARVYQNWGIGNPPGDNSVETTIATFQQTIQLNRGDTVRVYVQRDTASDNNLTFWGNDGLWADKIDTFALKSPRPNGMIENPTYFSILQQTTYPESNAAGFLIHDAAAAIAARTTDVPFYSEFLGSEITKYRQYNDDGCGWTFIILKGLQLRGYDINEKPFFLSFEQWWQGANPIFNLGLGYEQIDPSQLDAPTIAEFNDDQQFGSGEDWTVVPTPTRYTVDNTGFSSSKILAFEIFGGVQDATYHIGYDLNFIDSGSITVAIRDALLNVLASSLVIEGTPATNRTGTANLVATGGIPKYVTFHTGVGNDADVLPFTFSVTLPTTDPFTVIRCEEKAHFYDDSDTSVDFSNVRRIRKMYDVDREFNVVEIGYQKWNAEDVQGLDDPQSKRTWSTRFKKIGQKISLFSQWIAASLTIEVTRRTTREKSADYKYDNDTFIVSVDPVPTDISPETSPDLVDFVPELEENFTSVTNLENSGTRYNLRLTPARNLLRWLNYLQGCLQYYIGSVFRFASGEGNYDMTSAMTDQSPGCRDDFAGAVLSEKADITVTDDYLHLDQLIEITDLPVEYEEYRTIVGLRKKAIGISQTGENHGKFFIKSFEYKINQGLADLVLWPKSVLDLQVVETVAMTGCEEAQVVEDDTCFIITEGGDAIITEDNQLIGLESC